MGSRRKLHFNQMTLDGANAMHIKPEPNPRPARMVAYEHCTVAREDGSLETGLLLNLSEEGFCVQTTLRPEHGERVEMRVVGLGRVSGIVRWTDGMRAGGVLEPFTTGAFDDSNTGLRREQP